MMNPSWVSARMERGTVLLFVAAGLVMGSALSLPAIRAAIDIAGGSATISLLTRAEVPRTRGTDGAAIASATFDSARVVAEGLSANARTLLVLGAGFSALTTLLTVSAVVLFFLLLMWRRPFHRALITATRVAGAALLIGGMLSAASEASAA